MRRADEGGKERGRHHHPGDDVKRGPVGAGGLAHVRDERLDTGDGVIVFTDIYGATPCNLAFKLLQPGRIEGIAGVNLPMLVRAFTYRTRGMETLIKKAVSGGCEGVLHVDAVHEQRSGGVEQ